MALQMGSRGADVSSVQGKLNALLMPSPQLVTDGVFGMKTAQAVRTFQQRKGLAADGVVGPKTAAALGLPNLGHGGGGGGGGGGLVHPSMPPPPGNAPPGFVDLSRFNVVIEAIISGVQNVASALLSWIDSDYVPQIIYDRVASEINGAISAHAAQLRGITAQAVTMGQDPAAFVTGKIQVAFDRVMSRLGSALQPLVGLPIIGSVASRYMVLLGNTKASVTSALGNLRNNGQAAQAIALQMASIFQNIARQIS